MQWLLVSIVASVVLTIVLNVAIRLWPRGADRATDQFERWATEQPSSHVGGTESGTRVIVPWKAMLIGSIVLTVVLNLVLLVLR